MPLTPGLPLLLHRLLATPATPLLLWLSLFCRCCCIPRSLPAGRWLVRLEPSPPLPLLLLRGCTLQACLLGRGRLLLLLRCCSCCC